MWNKMVIKIHVYGFLKQRFDPTAKMSENTIITLDHLPEENFGSLLTRLKVTQKDLGDCFINSVIANEKSIIPDNARIALFGSGMRLLCGGQHLKGHGMIEKKKTKKVDYYF